MLELQMKGRRRELNQSKMADKDVNKTMQIRLLLR